MQAGDLLRFVPWGQGESATGKRMLSARTSPEDASAWRVMLAVRGKYRAVRVPWRESGFAARVTETVRSGKLASLGRWTARLSIPLHPGQPVVVAEGHLILVGSRSSVDGTWRCKAVSHKLVREGYSTSAVAMLGSGVLSTNSNS